VTRDQAIAEIRSIQRRCRGPLDPSAAAAKNALLAEGRLEEAVEMDAAGRPGCGYDMNDTICAQPFDGKPRQVNCPLCGQLINYTPPRYDLEEA
jgi:hypothetical protein